jgi:5'-deoxynucleotidase
MTIPPEEAVCAVKNRFFALLERLRWIQRWGLKRNLVTENVMEHSWQVATIAHALAEIHRNVFGGDIDSGRVVIAALYHDASEIITGDLPSPIKYHSERIRDAYKMIEAEAEQQLLDQLPPVLQPAFAPVLLHSARDEQVEALVKAADMISAYLKCRFEVNAGNREFHDALAAIEQRIRDSQLPEVQYFMQTFVDSYLLTLDELLRDHDQQLQRTR